MAELTNRSPPHSHTNKSKHKPSRKRAAGRKGTVDEYDYLISSIGRLVTRVDEKSGEPRPSPGIFRLTITFL